MPVGADMFTMDPHVVDQLRDPECHSVQSAAFVIRAIRRFESSIFEQLRDAGRGSDRERARVEEILTAAGQRRPTDL